MTSQQGLRRRYPTIRDAAAALRTGRTTSVDLVRESMATADAAEHLAVYVSRFDRTALAAAAKADEELAVGIDRGVLHGVPLAVKDIIATREGETTAQSRVFDREWGSAGDAPAVARLRAAGAVITGKTTTMEYAIGLPELDGPFPVPRNPWNTDHYSGGSSSGTAAGVATGIFFGGLGTDTGGSVRYPAAVCGVTGLKPTFGRVPKTGCVPLAHSYDHVGPIAPSAADCAVLLQVLAQHDPLDPTSADRPVDDYSAAMTGSLTGMRIGVALLLDESSATIPELEPRLAAAIEEMRSAGAIIKPVELPLYREIQAVATLGLTAEGYSYHRRDLQRSWFEYGKNTRMALVQGALLSAGDYLQMQRVRRIGRRRVAELFREVDLILTPTAACGAARVDDLSLTEGIDAAHTPYWDAMGNPAISVPMGFTDDGLPLGVQIAGRPFAEADVLAAAHAYQLRTDWHCHVPEVSPAVHISAADSSLAKGRS